MVDDDIIISVFHPGDNVEFPGDDSGNDSEVDSEGHSGDDLEKITFMCADGEASTRLKRWEGWQTLFGYVQDEDKDKISFKQILAPFQSPLILELLV